jgi:protein-disulfide isomerase
MTVWIFFETIKSQFMTHNFRALIVATVLTGSAIAQTQPAHAAKAQAKPATAAATPAAKTELPSEDTVNSFLYQMFGYDATITWKIAEIRPSDLSGLTEVTVIITNPQGSNANKLYVSADGKHAITGDVLPFGAKPFDDARAKLEKGINGAAKGPANAPVMVVEFSDMQCPHCKTAAPNIEQLLAQEPDVHFVFQNFPLPAHNWADKAADYVDCVGRASNDAVWKFIQKTFDQQSNITESSADEKLKAIASDSGVNADEIAACAAKPETKARIEASVALGKSVGVTGTPMIFINGRALSGATPVDLLRKIVEFQASQAKGGKQEAENSK